MVVPFSLKKTDDDTGAVTRYDADNINTLSVDFSTPLAPMPLPQQADTENVLIKVEGNTTTSNIAWKIRDLETCPFVAESGTLASSPTSAIDIIEFFKTQFVPITVADSYVLTIANNLVLQGTLMRMSFSLSASSPVVWECNLQFIHGNVAASIDPTLASPPVRSSSQVLLVIQDDSGSGHKASVPNIITESFGNATGITGYAVKYKKSTASGWSRLDANDITYSASATTATDQSLTLDLDDSWTSSEKVYDFKISALTSTNTDWNQSSSVVENVTIN